MSTAVVAEQKRAQRQALLEQATDKLGLAEEHPEDRAILNLE